jgi:hypothetical protein
VGISGRQICVEDKLQPTGSLKVVELEPLCLEALESDLPASRVSATRRWIKIPNGGIGDILATMALME